MLGHKNQSADSVYKSDLPSGDVADQPPKDENSTHEKDAQTTPKANNSKCWIDEGPFQGEKLTMDKNESKFWQDLVEKYLDPKDVKMKKDLTGELKELRNNVCSGMALVNILWITVNFMFQFRSPTVVTFQLPIEDYGDEHGIYEMKIEMLGLLFIIFFLVLLLIQFCGMVMHRLGTFIHLVAITELWNPISTKQINRPPKNDSVQSIEISTLIQIRQLQEYGTKYISTPSSSEINSEQTEELRHGQSQPNLRHRLSKSETSNRTNKSSEH
ncbi:chitin synthase [Magallana gigas]|uniref:chitin synthase n=1 Tax=Magallana gigas TaxID=29159 RepID=UPI003342726C